MQHYSYVRVVLPFQVELQSKTGSLPVVLLLAALVCDFALFVGTRVSLRPRARHHSSSQSLSDDYMASADSLRRVGK